MRVVITQHLRSTPARGAVRIDQRLGIDLEMRFGPGMDIARGQRMRDPPRLAQQQTAGLAGESGARFGQHALMNTERNWQTILGSEFKITIHHPHPPAGGGPPFYFISTGFPPYRKNL